MVPSSPASVSLLAVLQGSVRLVVSSTISLTAHRWLPPRLDNLGSAFSLTTDVLVVTSAFYVDPAITGLFLSYSLTLAGIIQITLRYLADVDSAMYSTERLHQHATSLPSEASLEARAVTRPSWPETGELSFDSVSVRYRPDLPLGLEELSVHVPGGKRMAIVGRTEQARAPFYPPSSV